MVEVETLLAGSGGVIENKEILIKSVWLVHTLASKLALLLPLDFCCVIFVRGKVLKKVPRPGILLAVIYYLCLLFSLLCGVPKICTFRCPDQLLFIN